MILSRGPPAVSMRSNFLVSCEKLDVEGPIFESSCVITSLLSRIFEMNEYSASVAYGEPVLVDENDEIIDYPSASASYLNPTNDSVSVVDSYFFDIIDELAQDPDFIQDFGPVAMPIAQTTNARPVNSQGQPPMTAVSFAVADGIADDAGIIADSASYVSSPSFSDSFYFNVIEDQFQLQQYNQFLLDEENKKQTSEESKQSYYAPPVTYAFPASTFEKALSEGKESESKCSLAEEGNYGWNEKGSEFAPMKAPRLSKKMNRAIKQKNSVKAVKFENSLKVPNVLKVSKADVPSTATATATGPVVNAKSRAASMRQRVEGKFKKLQTKWVSAADFFVKGNSGSPVSPYSNGGGTGVSGVSGRGIDTLPNYPPVAVGATGSFHPTPPAAATAPVRGAVVNHVWNKWNQPPLDYGLPTGMQHYGASSSSSSSSSGHPNWSVHPSAMHYTGSSSSGTGEVNQSYTSRFGRLDLSSGGENS